MKQSHETVPNIDKLGVNREPQLLTHVVCAPVLGDGIVMSTETKDFFEAVVSKLSNPQARRGWFATCLHHGLCVSRTCSFALTWMITFHFSFCRNRSACREEIHHETSPLAGCRCSRGTTPSTTATCRRSETATSEPPSTSRGSSSTASTTEREVREVKEAKLIPHQLC